MELQEIKYRTYQDIKMALDSIDSVGGRMSKKVTVHEVDEARLHVFTPIEKETEVLKTLSHCEARITRRCVRTSDPKDVVLEVLLGTSTTGTVYTKLLEEEEIYSGEPFQSI